MVSGEIPELVCDLPCETLRRLILFHTMKRYLLSAVFGLFAATASAVDVTLIWDPSPSPDVVYKLYRNGTPIEVGANLTHTLDLTEKTTFFVTAFDPESSLESDPSNTVIWYPRPKPPTLLRITVTVDPSSPENAPAMDALAEKVRALIEAEKN